MMGIAQQMGNLRGLATSKLNADARASAGCALLRTRQCARATWWLAKTEPPNKGDNHTIIIWEIQEGA
jgi:hypothetical protein